MGRIKVNRVLREASISSSKTLVGLTHGQRGPSDQGSRLRGKLIVVSGPSGAGKSTLIEAALEAVPELAYSVSATTRKPREGEVEGRDYIFLSRGEFERWIEAGNFLEWAEYSGNLYGTPEHRVNELLESGRSVVLEIELQGAREVKDTTPRRDYDLRAGAVLGREPQTP